MSNSLTTRARDGGATDHDLAQPLSFGVFLEYLDLITSANKALKDRVAELKQRVKSGAAS